MLLISAPSAHFKEISLINKTITVERPHIDKTGGL